MLNFIIMFFVLLKACWKYLLNLSISQREPVLLKELRKVKTPTRTFQWPTQIWLPKNWIIRRNFQGQSEIIPTVLSNTPTSITTPRADPSQPVFLVEREIVHTTTTRCLNQSMRLLSTS